MISVLSRVQFLTFILLTVVSMTMANFIKLAFVDGVNLIRCSDNQLQVHQSSSGWGVDLNEDMQCNNKEHILDKNHVQLRWDTLTLRCLSSEYEMREEQEIGRIRGYKLNKILTEVEGHLSRSKDVYKLNMAIADDGWSVKIISEAHILGEPYFTENGAARIIYIRFLKHPTICRIVILGSDAKLCKDGENRVIDDAEYICYTDAWMDDPPSPAQFQAELEQMDKTELWQTRHEYLLEIGRPTFSVDTWSSTKEEIIKPSAPDSKNITKIILRPKINLPKGSAKKKAKFSVLKIIGIIVGVLLLFALIGGVVFYVIQKQRTNSSPPTSSLSSVNVEQTKKKDSPPPAQKRSDHSSVGDDENAGALIDQRSYRDKPNIVSQKSAPKNKAQRGATNMVYNDDG